MRLSIAYPSFNHLKTTQLAQRVQRTIDNMETTKVQKIAEVEKSSEAVTSTQPESAAPAPEEPQQEFDQTKNVYVKNFGADFTREQLEELFSRFGTIVSATVAMDEANNSKGFGFVAFESRASALAAIRTLNAFVLANGRRIFVAQFQKKEERVAALQKRLELRHTTPPTVFIHALNEETPDEKIAQIFSDYGTVRFVKRPKFKRHQAFVTFATYTEARAAVELANDTVIDEQKIFVAMARPLSNRVQPRFRPVNTICKPNGAIYPGVGAAYPMMPAGALHPLN